MKEINAPSGQLQADEVKYTINDLPRFSPWPARLLGLEEWYQRLRTSEDTLREYDQDKWGNLLARLRDNDDQISISEIDRMNFGDDSPVLYSSANDFELRSIMEVQKRYLDLIADALLVYLPASALVELGAGYGSVLLALAQRDRFAGLPLIAGEYTKTGLQLIEKLALAQNLEVTTGYCDFSARRVTDLAIPKDALIYTSYATSCVSELGEELIRSLAAFQPKAVVHVEPCYEHCDHSTVLGLMRRRYIEVNDYNTNMIDLLHDQQALGRVKILREDPAVFGMNPLFAASIVIWVPQ